MNDATEFDEMQPESGTGEAVKLIAALAQSAKAVERIKIDDLEYFSREIMLPPGEPVPERLVVSTLLGIVNLAREADELNLILHVENSRLVNLIGEIRGRYRKRTRYGIATFEPPRLDGFTFSQFISIERMVLGLLSLFQESTERDDLLKMLGTIEGNDVKTAIDDGVSQTVVAKTSVVSLGQATLRPVVMLYPMRTFPEIEQPSSRFVFRMRTGKELPEVALFPADGGDWDRVAIVRIIEKLKSILAPAGAEMVETDRRIAVVG